MPLDKSGTKASIGTNIKTLESEKYPHKQAIAIALDTARRYGRAFGGPGLVPPGAAPQQEPTPTSESDAPPQQANANPFVLPQPDTSSPTASVATAPGSQGFGAPVGAPAVNVPTTPSPAVPAVPAPAPSLAAGDANPPVPRPSNAVPRPMMPTGDVPTGAGFPRQFATTAPGVSTTPPPAMPQIMRRPLRTGFGSQGAPLPPTMRTPPPALAAGTSSGSPSLPGQNQPQIAGTQISGPQVPPWMSGGPMYWADGGAVRRAEGGPVEDHHTHQARGIAQAIMAIAERYMRGKDGTKTQTGSRPKREEGGKTSAASARPEPQLSGRPTMTPETAQNIRDEGQRWRLLLENMGHKLFDISKGAQASPAPEPQGHYSEGGASSIADSAHDRHDREGHAGGNAVGADDSPVADPTADMSNQGSTADFIRSILHGAKDYAPPIPGYNVQSPEEWRAAREADRARWAKEGTGSFGDFLHEAPKSLLALPAGKGVTAGRYLLGSAAEHAPEAVYDIAHGKDPGEVAAQYAEDVGPAATPLAGRALSSPASKAALKYVGAPAVAGAVLSPTAIGEGPGPGKKPAHGSGEGGAFTPAEREYYDWLEQRDAAASDLERARQEYQKFHPYRTKFPQSWSPQQKEEYGTQYQTDMDRALATPKGLLDTLEQKRDPLWTAMQEEHTGQLPTREAHPGLTRALGIAGESIPFLSALMLGSKRTGNLNRFVKQYEQAHAAGDVAAANRALDLMRDAREKLTFAGGWKGLVGAEIPSSAGPVLANFGPEWWDAIMGTPAVQEKAHERLTGQDPAYNKARAVGMAGSALAVPLGYKLPTMFAKKDLAGAYDTLPRVEPPPPENGGALQVAPPPIALPPPNPTQLRAQQYPDEVRAAVRTALRDLLESQPGRNITHITPDEVGRIARSISTPNYPHGVTLNPATQETLLRNLQELGPQHIRATTRRPMRPSDLTETNRLPGSINRRRLLGVPLTAAGTALGSTATREPGHPEQTGEEPATPPMPPSPTEAMGGVAPPAKPQSHDGTSSSPDDQMAAGGVADEPKHHSHYQPRDKEGKFDGGPVYDSQHSAAQGSVQGHAAGGLAGIPSHALHLAGQYARGGKVIIGPVMGNTGGRADKLPVSVPKNSFVIPADVVSHLGEGNTGAGMKVLEKHFGASYRKNHEGVPILISDGEYVISPETVLKHGHGDIDAGHKFFEDFVLRNRAHHIKTLSTLPGPAR